MNDGSDNDSIVVADGKMYECIVAMRREAA